MFKYELIDSWIINDYLYAYNSVLNSIISILLLWFVLFFASY